MYLYHFKHYDNLIMLSDIQEQTKAECEEPFYYTIEHIENPGYYCTVYTNMIDKSMEFYTSEIYPEEDHIDIKYDIKVTPYKGITEYYRYIINPGKYHLVYRKYILDDSDVNKYNDLLMFYILYNVSYYANNVCKLPTMSSVINTHPSEFSKQDHPYMYNKMNEDVKRTFTEQELCKFTRDIMLSVKIKKFFFNRYYRLYTQVKEYYDHRYLGYTKPGEYDKEYLEKYINVVLQEPVGSMDNGDNLLSIIFKKTDKKNVYLCNYFTDTEFLDASRGKRTCKRHLKNIGLDNNKEYSALIYSYIKSMVENNLIDDFKKDITVDLDIYEGEAYRNELIPTLRNTFLKNQYNLTYKIKIREHLKNYMDQRWDYEIACDIFEGLKLRDIRYIATQYNIDASLPRFEICNALSKILDSKKEEYKNLLSACTNTVDPISGEPVGDIDSRKIITITQGGKQYCFEVDGIYENISKGNLENPYTRELFDKSIVEKIEKEYMKFKAIRGTKFDEDKFKTQTNLTTLLSKLSYFLPEPLYTTQANFNVDVIRQADKETIDEFIELLKQLFHPFSYPSDFSLVKIKKMFVNFLIDLFINGYRDDVVYVWEKIFPINPE